MDVSAYARSSPQAFRAECRSGRFTGPTAGVVEGFVQANLVIVPTSHAPDFEQFCRQNHRACPLLEVLGAGTFRPKRTAEGADLRTDLPGYIVHRLGIPEPPVTNVTAASETFAHTGGSLSCFLLGCSFSFEFALMRAGIPVRHIEEGRNVPMFRTTLPCVPSGAFAGPLVVSMRPLRAAQIELAAEISGSYPLAHGAPIHVGSPGSIGIRDLTRPDFGDAVTIRKDEIPVFWACGVTPMAALANARLDLAITHEPGHMFVTDLRDDELLGRTEVAMGRA